MRSLILFYFALFAGILSLSDAAHPDKVAHWRFENNLKDSSGNGNNGSLAAGSLAYTAGKFGRSIDLSSSQRINTQSSIAAGATQITVTGWVRYTGLTDNMYLYSEVGSFLTYFGWQINNQTVRLVGRPSGGGPFLTFVVSPPLPANVWVHVAGVYDSDANYAAIYFDGELVAESTNELIPFISNPGNLTTSFVNLPAGFYFVGQLDEVRMYRAALSSSDVRRNMLLFPPLARQN